MLIFVIPECSYRGPSVVNTKDAGFPIENFGNDEFGGPLLPNPDTNLFAKSHEWVAPDGTSGISDHAQKEITDVVFVELPKIGKEVKAGEPVAVVESVKAAFDIYAPVSGKVSKVNADVSKNPAIVNQDPYGKGWLFAIERSAPGEEAKLMSHAAYQDFLKDETH